MEINPQSPMQTQTSTKSVASGKEEQSFGMGKDDFLMLFMEGLKNQDPLNPMDNSEMMRQIAQLGNMEQVTKMAQSVEELQETVAGQKIAQGTAFIGREVAAFDGDSTLLRGEVDSVEVGDNGLIQLLIDNEKIQIGQIKEVY
jgi:flagellar basal-body rod modification protein FlgD